MPSFISEMAVARCMEACIEELIMSKIKPHNHGFICGSDVGQRDRRSEPHQRRDLSESLVQPKNTHGEDARTSRFEE
jgi:hypothetical protein